MGTVAALVISLAVSTASTAPTAAAAGGPSVQPPSASPVPVGSVGQGSRGTEKDEAAQSARRGDQSGLPTSLPGEGTYSATSLSQSGKWDVAGQTGDFTWSYPLRVPPSAGGLVPSLGLGYSSSAVDGLTSATNNQASWVGDGWALWPGFVERTYGSCQTDLPGDPKLNPGDLCWKSDNATLSLNGSQTALIRDDVSGVWKPKNDNGSRVERLTEPGRNADNDGEHWKVTTTDGTQYFFGYRAGANSTWTVPVYGDDTDEPCHRANDFAGSWCDQGYRFQLDKVVSPNGDVMTYDYGTEGNKYGQNKNTRAGQYVRGGWLKNIQYGLRDDTPDLAATGRVVFEEAERCVPGSGCDPNNAGHRANFPDVPLELKCDGTSCDKTWSPSFWTTKRLGRIRTEVRDGGGYRTVDSWALRHEFPYPNDNGKPALWLAGITHTGHDGGALSLPEVTFEGVRKPNRVVKNGDGASFLIRFRIGAIVSESGAVTSVNYAERNCDENTVITPESNALRCFPAKWSAPGIDERTDLFHKYVVASVSNTDWIGSDLSSETSYEYVGGAAWHYDESEFTRDEDKTWNQFRGYGKVIVRTGRSSDAPRTRTKVATTFYRGMNGDKGKPPVKVTDSENGSVDDHNWLNGVERESITYLGDTDEVVGKTISEPYWRNAPTAKRGVFEARIVREGTTRSFTMLADGRKQETKSQAHYQDEDPTAMVWRVHDFGDVAKADDDRCTTTSYARNTDKWLMALPSEVDVVAVACGAPATFPQHAIANDRTTYDDRGNVTSTQALKARPAADRFEHVTTSRVKAEDIDKHGRALKVADALGKVTTAEFTPAVGGPVTRKKSTNPLGFAITTTSNPATGATVKAVDVNGRVTESAYDPLGRLTQVWLPGRARNGDNGNKKFAYKISRTEPNVVTTRVLGPKGVDLPETKQILDGQLRPRQTQRKTDGGRLLTETRYDTHGRAFLETAPFFTSGDVDDKLWVASNSEAIPPHTVTEFDGAGRPTAEIFKAPTEKWRTTTTYGGNWVKVTPPAGGVPTTTLFDARGQTLERRTDAPDSSHDTTTYGYTAAGRLSEVKDPENNVWRNEYDLLGRLTVQHDPDRGTTRKTYDDLGRLVTTEDALGTVLRATYDDLGRPTLTEQVFPDRTEKRSETTYDTVANGKGLPATATRWSGTTAYTSSVLSYDRAGRPAATQVVIPDSEQDRQIAGTYVTTTRYNADGSLQSTGLPAVGVRGTPGFLDSETVLHEYDDLGRIRKTSGGPGNVGPFDYVTDTQYTSYGEPQQFRFGDEGKHSWVTMIYEPDTRRPERTIVDTQTSAPMQADVNYTYNPAGLMTSIVDQTLGQQADVQCFSYDHLQRLTSAWTPAKTAQPCAGEPSTGNLAGPAQYWQSFTYDKVGNRLTDTRHEAQGDTVRTYGKAGGHRMQSVSTAGPGLAAARVDEPGYDAAGNTVSRRTPSGATQQLDWDAEGRLAKVTEGTKVTEFVHGATGERFIRREPGSTTVYLGGQELQVKGTVKTATRYYSHGGRVVAARSGDRLDYVATDHQGTVNASVEVSSLKTERRRQLPFGGPRGPQGNFVGDRGFVGGTVDSSAGFTTLGARQYDPDTGRFLSVDPIGDFSDPQQLHGYSYAANSPISKSDPSGLLATPCVIDGPCANPRGDVPATTPRRPSAPLPKWVLDTQPARSRSSQGLPIPVGASPAHQIAITQRNLAEAAMMDICNAPNSDPIKAPFQCMVARGRFEAAGEAYDELLAKDRTAASNKAFGEKIKNALGDSVPVALCVISGALGSCMRPSGTTMGACGAAGVSAIVGITAEGCVVADDKGIGVVYDIKLGIDASMGVSAGLGSKIMRGGIEKQKNHPGEYAEIPFGRGEVEVGTSGGKLHSLGVYGGAHARAQIPGIGHRQLPSGGFDHSNAHRIVDVPNFCRYCQAASDRVMGWFK
ncbi:RHS repeat-associated protein [Saccharothrix saharensis]|uniref:RHS repeat-associated protein n=1 Tax=Saccharothrix saharensis TaxID=571190 RepID=A0A543JP37_9PSEU|nr:RHS repeat-associated core domain-containing protein [Saccharothrix saharensis]TQM84538.1 RHS repeat-associated protein [Saccharothrix saharensis]